MSKNIAIMEGRQSRNFTAKKIKTNLAGGGTANWIPEDEAADYCTFKKITLRQNGYVKAEDEACDGFSEVTVDIPSDTKEKVITTNGEYIAAEDNCNGYSKVTVNVAGGGSGSGQHTVIFYAADRATVLERVTVEDGGGAMYHGVTPASSGMRFVGWTPNPANVKADMNCYPRFENAIYDPTQIQDDWVTIAQKVRRDPDAYNIGQWKLLEMSPVVLAGNFDDAEHNIHIPQASGVPGIQLAMQLVGKGVDVLEGENGYAPTTWIAKNAVQLLDGNCILPWAAVIDDSWKDSSLRYYLNNLWFPNAFPNELKPYVRNIVKFSTAYDKVAQNFITDDPSIETLWIPSVAEMVGDTNYENIGRDYYNTVQDIRYTSAVATVASENMYCTRSTFYPQYSWYKNHFEIFNNGGTQYLYNQKNVTNGNSRFNRIGFCL